MLEKDIENLIATYPDDFFPGEGFRLLGRQMVVEGRRLDLLFADHHDRRIIVEVKRGILTREASGQIAEYYGLLKSRDTEQIYELVLCANVIPKERSLFLEAIGISCVELGVARLARLAESKGYALSERDHPRPPHSPPKGKETHAEEDEDGPSVWIFQANPSRYDILNSLDDPVLGNTTHWLVNQNRPHIRKGHLALIWLSGKEAGIYAICRIETDPAVMDEPDEEMQYWFGADDKGRTTATRVRLSVIRRMLHKPLLKTELQQVLGLSGMAILKQPQGTNFPVNPSEWSLLSEMI